MKLLILGGNGMAGHMLVDYFSKNPKYEVISTSRDKGSGTDLFLDVTRKDDVRRVVEQVRPNVVINCVGILNEHAAKEPWLAYHVNSVLPHQLETLMDKMDGRVIHLSTDCVFKGDRGQYVEADDPDGDSTYAHSKKLGEIVHPPHLTVRTSIIGPELKSDGIGLFLWFMNQTGTIHGYKNVWWNGVTTLELAKAIEGMIEKNVAGLYHLAAPTRINKHDLLKLIQKVYRKHDVTIESNTTNVLDRTIVNSRTDFVHPVPDYETMIRQLKEWEDQPRGPSS
ncbi:dTDP-4-dehydrorhamnose reductase [Pontibacillus halophilus JSM 076056 = DSM 19796]|uniref:dTDP-4-dehydrorhamnose reductase n=1 Tax=Pontibacillus halophilus JSM 076056 = DSM 19796 TaxID=1385510 RepID=A0A0A5I9B5_9BACI|nr:SDR family oxidoreductase [Pontibacillus halophilus]KGX92427.1 dTDP-4-dehydrorhamnose reductase [Pontibacillus halophilus JSM 076056 = DSM 19796]